MTSDAAFEARLGELHPNVIVVIASTIIRNALTVFL